MSFASPQAEWPTNFLIYEMVEYYINRENERLRARDEWLKIVQDGTISETEVVVKKLADDVSGKLFPRETVESKLESLGYRIGYALIERHTRDYPRFPCELDCVKFICKEFWTNAFGKQVDNLRTNHQGIYVIQDNKFHLLTSMSNNEQYAKDAAIYLSIPVGIIRGALSNLGIEAKVSIMMEELPIVRFNISVQAADRDEANES